MIIKMWGRGAAEARLHGMQKVVGSNPTGSTTLRSSSPDGHRGELERRRATRSFSVGWQLLAG